MRVVEQEQIKRTQSQGPEWDSGEHLFILLVPIGLLHSISRQSLNLPKYQIKPIPLQYPELDYSGPIKSSNCRFISTLFLNLVYFQNVLAKRTLLKSEYSDFQKKKIPPPPSWNNFILFSELLNILSLKTFQKRSHFQGTSRSTFPEETEHGMYPHL